MSWDLGWRRDAGVVGDRELYSEIAQEGSFAEGLPCWGARVAEKW